MKHHKLQKQSACRRPKTRRTACDARVEILSAARCVFAKRGLDATSVREVAVAVRVK